MGRAGTKVGVSDPAVLDGKTVAQQIKGTPGITGLSPLSVHSGEEVWHLNTSGCCRSDPAPTIRLITVDPSVRWDDVSRHCSRFARQYRGKSPVNTTHCLGRYQAPFGKWSTCCSLLDDPVTTDPKGEASDSLRGNTPTL